MKKILMLLATLALPIFTFASEAELEMPHGFATNPDTKILYWGFLIVILGLLFGFYQFFKVRKLKAHSSMLEIGNVIFKTWNERYVAFSLDAVLIVVVVVNIVLIYLTLYFLD